jgi:hypothetical protein
MDIEQEITIQDETRNEVTEVEIPDKIQEDNLPAGNEQAHLISSAAQEVLNIRKLIHAGVVAPFQGQNLIQQVIQRAYSVITNKKEATSAEVSQDENFNDEFFTRAGRNEVLEYLKQSGAGKDEISRITELVEKVEKAAIEDYLKKQEREKTLNENNEAAKRKLRVNAQKPCGSVKMVFTREQIGKMSGAEFAQHERSIMEQLRKGLIK